MLGLLGRKNEGYLRVGVAGKKVWGYLRVGVARKEGLGLFTCWGCWEGRFGVI